MSAEYWPWWVGGPMLAAVALLYPLLTGTPLGVSGALSRLLRWRSEGSDARPGGANALAAGTAPGRSACDSGPSRASAGNAGPDRTANLLFLVGIVAGGAVAGFAGGKTWGSLASVPEFHRLFGSGITGALLLFVGGTLVGFGARWSGGCTSGHGLSGCGRLQPASLVATAVFFGVAIGVSFLVEALRS